MLDENENDIPDENEHEIEGVPEEPELKVEADEGAADDPAVISGNESDDKSDARLDRTEKNSAEPVETTGVDNTTLEMDQQYGERTHEHKLRPRRPREYDHMHAQLKHVMMTQFSIRKGLEEFGEAGAYAVLAKCNNCIIGR